MIPTLQIEECPLDEELRVPVLVRTCCGVVEERGLEVVGVYRVPGNSAAVNQLTEQVNRGEFRSVYRSVLWDDTQSGSELGCVKVQEKYILFVV